MPTISFPYGKDFMTYDIPDSRFRGELVSRLHRYRADKSQEELVREALEHPIGTPALRVMAEEKKKVVLIASDHTRPVPSKIIVPRMLEEIRRGNPGAEVTILVATGCHRETTREELESKFGPEIIRREKIVIHDCDSPEMANLGKLPSGGDLIINKLAAETELLVAEGFIEPHFFAGFSGGRKSVFPGIASRTAVVYNHNAEFIAHPAARTGIIDGNPIHIDMLYAARKARLGFICNVVLNAAKEIIYAVAGDCDLAHRSGADFLLRECQATPALADIVVSTNGGYPLDQNIYQAVKGMTAAEASVREGGVIIQLAKSDDGHGAPEFHKTFIEEKDLNRMLDTFMRTPKENTRPDQWQSQILARVLKRARVVYVSDAPDEMVRDFQMIPAHSLEEAVKMAEEILRDPNATITVIPDGVSVVVKKMGAEKEKLLNKLKRKAKEIKYNLSALYLAYRRKDIPILAKIIIIITIGYALSPIDLIPDFIPVIGYLDDFIILPILILLSIKLIPKGIMEECKEQAKDLWKDGKPKKWYYAIPIILIYSLIIFIVLKNVFF